MTGGLDPIDKKPGTIVQKTINHFSKQPMPKTRNNNFFKKYLKNHQNFFRENI